MRIYSVDHYTDECRIKLHSPVYDLSRPIDYSCSEPYREFFLNLKDADQNIPVNDKTDICSMQSCSGWYFLIEQYQVSEWEISEEDYFNSDFDNMEYIDVVYESPMPDMIRVGHYDQYKNDGNGLYYPLETED